MIRKIYLDTCCYNRPFDNLLDGKIRLEAEAILSLCTELDGNDFKLFTSRMVDYELGKMKNLDKKEKVLVFRNSIASVHLSHSGEIERIASDLENLGIKFLDALHIAYCEYYRISYLLTTDKILINASKRANLFTNVVNPLFFVMEVL